MNTINSHNDYSDAKFEALLCSAKLDPTLFTHEAHIRLAYMHIRAYGVDLAVERVSQQISHYVTQLGAYDKYHHTLTIASTFIVNHFYHKAESKDFLHFISLHPRLLTHFRELLESHYSRKVYLSDQARHNYLEPDLVAFG